MGKYKNPIPDVDIHEKIEVIQGEELANDYLESKSVYFAFIDILGFKKAFDDNRNKKIWRLQKGFGKFLIIFSS